MTRAKIASHIMMTSTSLVSRLMFATVIKRKIGPQALCCISYQYHAVTLIKILLSHDIGNAADQSRNLFRK